VIERLAVDLRAAFPVCAGSRVPTCSICGPLPRPGPRLDALVQTPAGRLSWSHLTVMLDKLEDPDEREWYAAAAVEHGWSHHARSAAHPRDPPPPASV